MKILVKIYVCVESNELYYMIYLFFGRKSRKRSAKIKS